MMINQLKNFKDLTIQEAQYFNLWTLEQRVYEGIHDGDKFMCFYNNGEFVKGYIESVKPEVLKRMQARDALHHLKATSILL